MNDFAEINDAGILKDNYETLTPLEKALKKKRDKLSESKLGLSDEGENE